MKAVFLDRDGTINIDSGYIRDPDDLHLIPGAAGAIRTLNEMGYLVIVVTNQSGVARGIYNADDVDKVNGRLLELLAAEGAHVDKVYWSPYYVRGEVAPWNIEHEDRKPGIGMFRRACRDFPISTGESWMVGDRMADLGFGRNAGLKTILVETGDGRNVSGEQWGHWEVMPHFIAPDLQTAVKIIAKLLGN